jgi:serine/threonine protein kinase
MSPEQLRGKTIDGRSDIFSFGALLFEMVSGHQAFGKDNNAETISAILNEPPNFSLLPRKFRPVVQKAMQKRAADRYQTISELSDDLRVLVDDTAKDTDPEYSFTNWFGARSVISTAFRRYISGKVPRSGAGRSYYRCRIRTRMPEPCLLRNRSFPNLSPNVKPFSLMLGHIYSAALPSWCSLLSRLSISGQLGCKATPTRSMTCTPFAWSSGKMQAALSIWDTARRITAR